MSINILATKNCGNGIYNIAGGEKVTISKVAKIIVGLSSNELELNYHKPRHGDIKHSEADITKAGGFGYKPRWTIQKGLESIMIEHQELNK